MTVVFDGNIRRVVADGGKGTERRGGGMGAKDVDGLFDEHEFRNRTES